MSISVNRLNKHFGDFHAVQDVDFEIESGKLVGLLGPSGGGKTTILRMLAGLEFPDSGDIYLSGKRVNDEPPQKRGIGFVFQNYALFKHMNVYDNIAFGLTIRKWKSAQIKERVSELLGLIGLSGLERRYPHELSGGQRQRVAFARALAPQPELLLLDEPFAAIDAKVRKELRTWLKEMIGRLGVTTIFVTHDQEEAVEVADEIIVVNQGRLEQKGSPLDVYRQPQTPFVARFIGESVAIEQPERLKGFAAADGSKAFARPEHIEVSKRHHSAAETGTVRQVYFRGSVWQLEVEVNGQLLQAYDAQEKDLYTPGDKVYVLIHRIFAYNGNESRIIENQLKIDPEPVYI